MNKPPVHRSTGGLILAKSDRFTVRISALPEMVYLSTGRTKL